VKLLLICSLSALLFRACPATSVVAAIYAIWASLRRDDLSVTARTLFVGTLVPLCGIFPDLVAGLIFLALLCLDGRSVTHRSIAWASPLLILTGAWATSRFVIEFDVAPFVNLMSGRDGPGVAGLSNLLRWMRGGPPGYFVAVEDFIRVLLIASLWSSLPGERGKAFCKGLILGGVACSFFAIVEGVAPSLMTLLREPSPFWRSINRMASFSTDPNALGVLVGVLIPLAYANWGARSLWVVALLILGGLYSGSRSFFLIPVITIVYVLWRTKGLRFACVNGATVGLVAVLILASTSFLPHQPAGLVRLVESLNPANLSTTLESRSIFTRLSWHAFVNYPLFGVGLGRFDDYVVPYSHQLNLGVGVWRDGATSVYLEVLCELGLFGALVFGLTAAALRPLASSSIVYRGVSIAFLLVLSVLPHTNFPEGVAVAGLLLAQTVEPRRVARRTGMLVALAVAVAIPFAYQPRAIYGFYPWEQTGAEFVRWTAVESRGVQSCFGNSEIKLRNETPTVQDVEVRLSTGTQLRALQRGENLSFVVPCQGGSASYMLNVWPGFTPSKFGFKGDDRLLGVRQLSNQPMP
jgi:hypothetical protein